MGPMFYGALDLKTPPC